MRRVQLQRWSRKRKGEKRWLELEMWPVVDPVTDKLALLVSQHNVTHSMKVGGVGTWVVGCIRSYVRDTAASGH